MLSKFENACFNKLNLYFIKFSFNNTLSGKGSFIKSMHKDKSTNFLEHRQFQRFQGLLHCKFQLQLRVHFFHYRNHQK